MTQDEIIRMAREAGFWTEKQPVWEKHEQWIGTGQELERFAALVAAHERNRLAWTQEHWTQYEHAIAAAEREACAKVCDTEDVHRGNWYAAAIRARNNNG